MALATPQILDQYPVTQDDTCPAAPVGIDSGHVLCRSRFIGSESEAVNLVSSYAGIEQSLTWYAYPSRLVAQYPHFANELPIRLVGESYDKLKEFLHECILKRACGRVDVHRCCCAVFRSANEQALFLIASGNRMRCNQKEIGRLLTVIALCGFP